MKHCPTCNRPYEDDTLVFCLEDGARLAASYDPHATLRPAARDTNPPGTEVLPSGLPPPANPSQPHLGPPVATAPFVQLPGAQPSYLPRKRGGTHWIILSGTLALGLVGLVIVLGYLAWKATSTSKPEPYSAVVPANANRDPESKLPNDSGLQWLDGIWEGEGYQSDTKTTWAVRLTVRDGTYTIEYPNIPCQGRWTLIDKNSAGASFTEVITEGTDLCSNNSHVIIEKTSDSEISCKYTSATSRVVIATAILTKRALSSDQK